jgi:5-methylcytosine-specific restriction enzyme A
MASNEYHKEYMYSYRRNNIDRANSHNEKVKQYHKTKNGRASIKAASLNNASKKRNGIGKVSKEDILKLWDNYLCIMCNDKKSKLQIDHIKPIALGGYNTYENLQLLCIKCHKIKSSYEKMLKTAPYNIPDWFYYMINRTPPIKHGDQLNLF